MGAVGVCWDNAVAESFLSHLKTEMYYHQLSANHLGARTAVMEYIDMTIPFTQVPVSRE